MAKTRAPLLSAEAMGSIAKTIVMSKGRRQSYTKFLRKPKDPRSYAQMARRAFWKGLANAWSLLPPASKASWDAAPNPKNVSVYNTYMSYNMGLIHRGLYPTSIYPWTGLGGSGTFTQPVLTPGPRHVSGDWPLTTVGANWLLLVYLTDFPAPADTQLYLHRVVTRTIVDTETYIDAPLHQGAWYYQARSVTTRGKPYLYPWAPSVNVPAS